MNVQSYFIISECAILEAGRLTESPTIAPNSYLEAIFDSADSPILKDGLSNLLSCAFYQLDLIICHYYYSLHYLITASFTQAGYENLVFFFFLKEKASTRVRTGGSITIIMISISRWFILMLISRRFMFKAYECVYGI